MPVNTQAGNGQITPSCYTTCPTTERTSRGANVGIDANAAKLGAVDNRWIALGIRLCRRKVRDLNRLLVLISLPKGYPGRDEADCVGAPRQMPINAAMPLTVRKTILLRPHGVPWEVFSICDYNLHNVKSHPAGWRTNSSPTGSVRHSRICSAG